MQAGQKCKPGRFAYIAFSIDNEDFSWMIWALFSRLWTRVCLRGWSILQSSSVR
jgi:hypothetical protein